MNPLPFLIAGCFFMEFLDGTIIVPALPQMAASLGTNAVDLHVGISAYLLTVAVMILPGGWAAERFGARAVFTTAIAIFTLASGLCALAVSSETFVAARVLQGVGGAMMVPVGRLVVLRTTPKSGLMRAIATLTWPGLTAPLFGPPLGGFIAEHWDWRFIFLVNLPLGLVAMLLALRLVPRVEPSAPRPFDFVGFVLAGAACLCAELALDLMGRADPPWATACVLAGIGLVAGLAVARHLHRHKQPLIDPAPWRIATFRMVMVTGTAMRSQIAAMPFLLPLLFQLGFGYDAFHAGSLVLALFVGNIGMKPMTSWILRRWGFRSVIVGNALIQAVTMLGCAVIGPATPMLAILPLLIVSGASRSMQFTCLATLAFADVPQDRMAAANTWFSVAFQLGNGMGVAIGAVLLRLAATLGNGRPDLLAFHGAFAALAGVMFALAAAGLRLRPEAGAAVSGHRSSMARA
ncbi:MAG TPA: MFS transporter [Acetobacteraceae bacterium]|nr:MFS transporter [Acetobacteraceae bacterium]